MTDQAGLFDVAELAARPREGRAEAGLRKALEAAAASAIVGPVDAGLAAAALIAARAMDDAETLPPYKAPYAVAQLLPAYQRALHGLRLPAEVTPVMEKPAQDPAAGAGDLSSLLGDAFGPS